MADAIPLYAPALSDEIYLMILKELQLSSPQSMLNVCLTSRRLCHLATSCIYRSVQTPHGKFCQGNQESPSAGYTFENNVMSHCRTLVVTERLNWKILANALPRMRNLNKLWLDIGSRDDEDIQDNDRIQLQHLVGILNIRSVKAEIVYEEPVAMRWLKDVLLDSKNLEILHITLPRGYDGSAQWLNDSIGAYDLCAEPGEQLQSVEELVYESRMYLGDGPYLIPLSFFNWSKIRRLTLRGQRMISMVMDLSTLDLNLTSLTIEYFCNTQDFEFGGQLLNDFISNMRGLENLTLVNPVKQLPTSTLAIHRTTLKEINIRHPRRGSDPYSMVYRPKPYLPTDLDDLRTACLHIETLSIDISFTSFLPYDILAALARFPKLTTLRIFVSFEADGRRGDTSTLPHYRTDLLTVRHMYSYIRSRKLDLPIRALDVMLGGYPRFVAGRPPSKSDRPNMWFKCYEIRGEIVVDSGFKGNENITWSSYFADERLSYTPGQTFPSNLEEILAAEAEADSIINTAVLVDENSRETGNTAIRNDVNALFEDSPGTS